MRKTFRKAVAFLLMVCLLAAGNLSGVMAEDQADPNAAVSSQVVKLQSDLLGDLGNWTGEPEYKDGVLTAQQSYSAITGYKGKKFRNETLQFKFKPDYTSKDPSWPAFTLRSKDAGKVVFDKKGTLSSAYMIVLKQESFEVQAFIDGDNKLMESIPHDKTLLESGKTYTLEMGAVDTADGKGVRIFLVINGKTYIDYLDKNALIKDEGYFAIYSFETPVSISPVSTVYSLGAEFPVVNLNSYLGSTDSWSEDAELKDGVLTVPTGWFTNAFIKNKQFRNELLKFKFKTELTPATWPAFLMRYQGAAEKFVAEEKGSCYMIVVKENTFEVQKFVQGAQRILSVQPNPGVIRSNVEAVVETGAVDTPDGVNIVMSVNGKKIIDYTDVQNSIANAGKFVFYGIEKPVTIKGLATPELLNVVNFSTVLSDKNWNEDAEIKNGVLTVPTGWFADAYNKTKKFKNEILQFKFKTELSPGAWPSFNLRYQGKNPGQFVGIDGGSSYIIVVKDKFIELQKFLNGKSTYLTVVPNNGLIKSNVETKIELGAVDTADGVNVILNANGKTVLDYMDTGDVIKNAGPLVFYGIEKPVTIKGMANTPVYKVVNINSLLSNKKWNEDAVVKNGVLTVPTGWFADAYNTSVKFKNEVVRFRFKTELAAGSWPAINLRYSGKNPGQFVGIDGGSCYMLVIKNKTIEVQKFVKGKQKVMAIYPNTSIKSNVECTLEAGAVDTTDGVAVILNVNGKKLINYTDVEASVKNPGYLVFYGVDKPVKISAIPAAKK